MQVSDPVRVEGARRFEVDPDSMKSLGGSDGAVYSCRRGSLAHVIKFIRLPAERAPLFEERLAFVQYLAQNEVPLAAPLPSASGASYETVCEPSEGVETCYAVTLTPWVAGRPPMPRNLYDWNEHLFHLWGYVTGKMHALARQYPHWTTGETTHLSGWQETLRGFAQWCQEPKITARLLELEPVFQGLPIERSGYGLVHNDLHPRNFLYNPDARGGSALTIIDYDACSYDWFINDIACSLYHAIAQGPHKGLASRRSFARFFLSHYMKGYQKANELDHCWLEQLPAFLRLREIMVYIALSHDWPEVARARWQIGILSEKRARALRGEAIIDTI